MLVFAGLAIAVSAGTCDPETSTLKPLFQTPAAQFSFQGARIVIQPWRKFGVPDPELSMKLDMRRLAEVARNSTGCPVPGIVSFVSDPDTPVTRELLIANCDCDFSWRNKTIQAGIHEEQLAIEVDCSNVDQALYGNLGLQIYFKRPNGNYSYHYDPAITSQNKTIDLGYRYVPENGPLHLYARFLPSFSDLRSLYTLKIFLVSSYAPYSLAVIATVTGRLEFESQISDAFSFVLLFVTLKGR